MNKSCMRILITTVSYIFCKKWLLSNISAHDGTYFNFPLTCSYKIISYLLRPTNNWHCEIRQKIDVVKPDREVFILMSIDWDCHCHKILIPFLQYLVDELKLNIPDESIDLCCSKIISKIIKCIPGIECGINLVFLFDCISFFKIQISVPAMCANNFKHCCNLF